MSDHRGMAFSTKGRDNDKSRDNCATLFKGAWWYNSCLQSNLNGLYHEDGADKLYYHSYYFFRRFDWPNELQITAYK